MQVQGIKIRLSFTIAGLLLIGMLLVNFVMLIFWQRDIMRREICHDQAVLARIADQISAMDSAAGGLTAMVFPMKDHFSVHGRGAIVLSIQGQDASSLDITDYFILRAVTANETSIRSGSALSTCSHGLIGFLLNQEPELVTTRLFRQQDGVVGSIALARSLEPDFQELWKQEKIILVYILVNLLVLSVIGFFRMIKSVVQPIDQLVRLANQYRDRDGMLFAADSPGGEFSRLASSLNSMLLRIEQDRQSLEETVLELADANTRLKQHQKEMLRTEKLASVGRMAAGLAHEIGNPLGVVQGYLGILAQSENLKDEYLDYIRRADDELQRVNTLIRQMLDFARKDQGNACEFSLHELLQSVAAMVEVQPACKGIKLRTILKADKDRVYAAQERLRQVFVNVILNSADAIIDAVGQGLLEREAGVIEVETDMEQRGGDRDGHGSIRIRIRDNGIGIASEKIADIFDPFYTSKEPGRGTGLGLSVSLSIVESCDGRMEMESREGEGSELSVLLPSCDS